MVTSQLVTYVAKFLYPFALLFGTYIIMNGDLSPGGGFQGGAIIATAHLLIQFIKPKTTTNIKKLITIEKYLFFMLLFVATLSYITKGEFFTNFIPIDYSNEPKRIFLVALNAIIGLKVALGLIIIFTVFIKEERS